MKRKLFCRTVAGATLLSGVSALFPSNASALVLVKEGQPRATIVVTKDASPQVRKAAQTLQEYVQRSTGAKLPIAASANGSAIIVGPSATAQKARQGVKTLDQDGFILQGIDARHYIIAGGSDWGTEFGVLDFLERYLGVRWLMPTETGIDVPRRHTIELPATRIVQNPVFLSRRLSPMSDIEADNAPARWGRFNRARGRIEFHHNLLHLFPASKFGKTHPEFYPILNGKRHIPTDPTDEGWQPNFSAPGIVDAAAAEIEEYFRKNPNVNSYSLGMNDSNGWDQSAASKARRNGKKNYLGLEDVSDDYFEWANAVVTKVLKKYPDKWFGTLAYHCIAEPPTRVSVHPRIVPFLTYDRMRWDDSKLRSWNQKLTTRWAKVSPILGWYDYTYGISYQLPRVYFHTMKNYLGWGAAHQVQFSYAELYPNWGEGPKPWVFTRLLWNPNQNVDALLDDWYTHCAGAKAAPHLREYYKVWERFWTVDIYKSAWNRDTGEYLPFDTDPSYLLDVPQSYVTRSDAAMQAALKLADTPQRKARVAKLKTMWEFYKSSILTYQGANAVNNSNPQSEAQARALLDKIETVTLQAQKRQNLLAGFRKDPLFTLTAKYITDYPGTTGQNWGSALLWQLYTWAGKGPSVKARLQELAKSPNASLQEQASVMLQTIDGKSTLVTQNNSFEADATGWNIWDKSDEGPEFHKGTWIASTKQAYDGNQSFLVQGLQRGGLIQTLPYKAGNYFARARSYAPKKSKAAAASLLLQVLGPNGEILDNQFSLPVGHVALQPGIWSITAVPFKLPEDKTGKATSVRMILMLTDFHPNDEIYLDDVGIYRIENE